MLKENLHVSSTRTTAHHAVTQAVVFRQPQHIEMTQLSLPEPADDEVVVDVAWSGISTGTERLLWSGTMPPFPGMGYPLVPGYESVGRVSQTGKNSTLTVGDLVFVPGARCFGEVRGLFGGTASRLVVPQTRAMPIKPEFGELGTMLALAATAYHALRPQPDAALPDLIVGHGVLGRLLARLTIALGGPAPTVWETQAGRRDGAKGYRVLDPQQDTTFDYLTVLDASGDASILDKLMPRLRRGGEIILAGFYSKPLSFEFPPAFMREARIRVAAEWQPDDFSAVRSLAEDKRLSLDNLISHRLPATEADAGYRTAFEDPDCLKMILDWRGVHSC